VKIENTQERGEVRTNRPQVRQRTDHPFGIIRRRHFFQRCNPFNFIGWGTWIRTRINGVRVLNPWFQHPSERFAVFLKSLKYMMLEKRPRE
jgi:hypothetical protein